MDFVAAVGVLTDTQLMRVHVLVCNDVDQQYYNAVLRYMQAKKYSLNPVIIDNFEECQ